MSRGRMLAALSASLAILVSACWLVGNTFPLIAGTPRPQAPPAIAAPAPQTAVYQDRTYQLELQRKRAEEEEALKAAARERIDRARKAAATEPQAAVPVEPQTVNVVEPAPPQRIRVGGNVQQARLISQPKPIYPPIAKQARIQGTVQMAAVIDRNGAVQQLEVISGHPLLVPAALEAVKDWVYEPTLLDNKPVEVTPSRATSDCA